MKRKLGCLGVLVLSVSLLLFARPAEAVISLKGNSHNQGKGGAAATTLALGPQAVVVGDLAVVVFVDQVGGAAPGIGDNLANGWSPLAGPTSNTVRMSAWFWRVTVAGSLNVTVTFGSSSAARAGVLGIFAGAATSPLDKNPANLTDSSSPYDGPLSGVLTQADEVVIGLFGLATPGSDSITPGFSETGFVDGFGTTGNPATGNAYALMTYRVVSATTSVAPQIIEGTTTTRAGVTGTATFKAQVPSQLAFSVQPSNAAGGAVISPAIKVQLRDSGGNLVTSATNPITLAIQFNAGPGGTLSGTFANVVPVNGEATFSDISIDKIGTGYTLQATSGALTSATSTPFNITLGAAAKLAFTTQPGNGTGGSNLATQPVVTVQDAGGNTVTTAIDSITLAIGTNPSSGTLTVTTNPLGAAAGVATFAGVKIDKAGTGYTLTASATGLTGATSTPFNITVGTASKLAYSVQPSNATTTVAISPAIKVQVQDAGGNLVTSPIYSIALAIGTNPGGGTLSGTPTQNSSSGEATFSNLSIDAAGTGYTLVASTTGPTSATSTSFRIFLASVKVGSFTKTTAVAPATQVVAHGLGEVPKAIIFWTNDLNTENFIVTPWFGFGFTDGTTSLSVAATSADGVATSNASRRMANKALTIVSEGEVLQAEADLQSWDATNFTLNWTTNQSFAGVIHFIAIGGSGVSAKVINWQMPTVLGLFSKNGIGFQPDVVIHANAGGGYGGPVGNTIAGASFGLGAMDKNGNQWSSGFFTADAVALADTQRGQVTNATLHTITGALGVSKSAAFSSMDADGFTVNFSVVSAATEMASLALKGVNVKAGSFTKSTGAQPASQPITGVGFTPSVVLLSSVQDVPQATPVAHSRFGLGASDGTTQGSLALSDQDAVTPTKVQGIDKTSKVFVKVNNSTPAIDAEANLTSLDSNGFTLNWTTNDAVGTEILYLAIGGGAPALNNFLVEAAGGGPIGTQTVGTPFNIKITARDASNNAVAGFTGTVDLTSTGTLSAGGGTTATFTNGVLTLNGVTISSVGSFTLTATKTGGGPLGTSTAFNEVCGSVTDAGYMAASATSTAATVYWSSANPVLILRKSGIPVPDTPVGGTTYSAGTQPWGAGGSTVVYSGSVAEKSVLDTVAGRTTTDRYKVFAKGVGSCYAPGLQVDAGVPSGGAWSYARSDGPLLKPGIAGAGALYIGGNGSKITSLSTADGSHSWDPVASTAAVQGWLTWLPVGGDVISGLAGHWKFDEGSGPTAADSSGNGNTGTLAGAPGPTWTTGKINGGLSFDGVDDSVDAGNPSSLQLTGAMTISAWAYYRTTGLQGGDGRRIVDKMGFSGNRGWGLTREGGDFMCFYIASNATTLLSACSINPTPLSDWVHWVGVYEPGVALRLYKNGVLDNSNTTGIPSSQYNSSLGVRLGRRTVSASGHLDGIIDDVRIYNRTLSAAEVSKLYLRGGGWPYRKKITIDKTKVAGALTDFPVLVSLTNDQDLKSKAQASGNDILFTAADGETKLSHEIEKYDPSPATGATLVAWVKVPSVSSTANTDIYMYYGDAGASDQQDKTGVWSSNFQGVWHLKEDPSGTAPQMKDSTSNANHGTSAGVMTSGDQVAGKVGGSLDFDGCSGCGLDDSINAGSGSSLDDLGQITFSAWIYPRSFGEGGLGRIVVKDTSLSPGNIAFQLSNTTAFCPVGFNTNSVYFQKDFNTATDLTRCAADNTLQVNTWQHYVVTWNGSGSGVNVHFYKNGVEVSSGGQDGVGTPVSDAALNLYIGNRGDGARTFDGLIDEVRISNVVRSAAWITTEYNNQSSPATFYSVGGEGQVTGATGAQQTVIGGDQSGRVYSMDAAAGFKHWGDTAALTGASAVQAGVSAQVRVWSNSGAGSFQATYTDDVIFAATSNASTTSNKVFALKASDGTSAGWTFNANGIDFAVDSIAGQPYVDYAQNRIYVVSRAGLSSNQQSLWVIKTVDGEGVLKGQPMACPACTSLPATGLKGVHFETSPTLSYDGNTLYIGDTAGKLYAVNAGALTLKWTLDLGVGVNINTSGFVWEDYTTAGRLYFVTADGNVRCVKDNGQGLVEACTGWAVIPVPGASTPLLLNKLFVGSSDGKVHQINLTTGADEKQFPAATTLDGTPLGAISTETGNEIFVGTSGGKIFKINLTLGALP